MAETGLGGFVSVTADDVALGWRVLTDDQHAAIDSLLGRAEPVLLAQSPGLLDRLASGVVPGEAVEQVLIQAVRRASGPLFNPEGLRSYTESLDDWSETKQYYDSLISAGLTFTPAELVSLLPPERAKRRGKAFTINTTPGGYR